MADMPDGLLAGGRALWRGVTADHDDLDAGQLATLEQACRMRDRADQLAPEAAAGDAGALRHERESGLAMTRLLAALRLPDEKTGRKPQHRGTRGAYQPRKTGSVSSLDRARARGA